VASVLALLALGNAHGQNLTEITITDKAPSQVSGFGDVPLSKAPFSAVTIDQQTLQDIGAQRVSDALRLDASVGDSYNSPAYWDILSVRGYTLDNRFNFRRDGLPVMHLTDEQILDAAITETSRHLGLPLTPTATRITPWQRAFPQYRPHHHRMVADIEARLPATLALAGASYHGIGIPACVRSGQRAAEVLGQVAGPAVQ
jgi:hypothetical protein